MKRTAAASTVHCYSNRRVGMLCLNLNGCPLGFDAEGDRQRVDSHQRQRPVETQAGDAWDVWSDSLAVASSAYRRQTAPPVAQGATIYSFEIQLSDVDRGVYEALALRVARQPSETAEYLLTRVLAYCLEYTDGIGFSRGLAEPDEPALAVRDLTGAWRAWIEIGAPDAARVHKASKTSPRVAIYTHKHAAQLVRQLSTERIHRA